MDKLTIIKLNNDEYFNTEELAVIKPEYFSECAGRVRSIVILKEIPAESYLYAYQKNGKWIISTPQYSKCKVLLTKDFCIENLFPNEKPLKKKSKSDKKKNDGPTELSFEEMTEEESAELAKRVFIDPYQEHLAKPTEHPDIVVEDGVILNEELVDKCISSNDLPPVLELNPDEMFKNSDDKPFNIMVRGTRNSKKIFFKGTDVESSFGLVGLVDDMTKNNLYENLVHYRTFNPGENIQDNKELFYLTFSGLIKVLVLTKDNKLVETFQDWLNDVLFTSRMGTSYYKNKLISDIKGLPLECVRELFCNKAKTIPCIYLCALNTVGKLRKSMNIPKNFTDYDIVYKFGITKSFDNTRCTDLVNLDKIKDLVDLKLIMFTYVDPLNIKLAVNEINRDVDRFKFNWDGHNDILVIPNNYIRSFKNIFENIGVKFSGHVLELHKIINRFDHEIFKLKKEILIIDFLYRKNIRMKSLEDKMAKAGLNFDFSGFNFFGNDDSDCDSDNNSETDSKFDSLIQINGVKYVLEDNNIYHIVNGSKGKLYGFYNPETNKVKKIKTSGKKSENKNKNKDK